MTKPNSATPSLPSHPLVGKWFHSYEVERPDVIRWQGQVLAAVSPDTFLVQLYEWFCGMPSKQVLVPLTEMLTWAFYETERQKDEVYEQYAARRNREFDAKHPIDLNPQPPDGIVN